MKNFKYLLLTLFVASTTFAQGLPIRNDTPTQLRDLGANLNVGHNFAVNKYGQLQCTLTAGDAGLNNALVLEDAAHTSGQAGFMPLGVRNDGLVAFSGSDLEYTPLAVTASGGQYVVIDRLMQGSQARGLLKNEDDPAASGDAAPVALYVTQDPLSVDQNTNGDYAPPKVDRSGRTIVTYAPASETWQACSAAAVNTSDTAIKAAVASNRIYVSSISCSNESAVASAISFKDGATGIYRGFITGNNLVGGFDTVLPIPLRGSVNTAFNFAMLTTATSTVCCASGFIATN